MKQEFKKVLFFALGVSSLTKKKVEKFVRDMVKAGQVSEQEARALVQDVMTYVNREQNKLKALIDRKAKKAKSLVDKEAHMAKMSLNKNVEKIKKTIKKSQPKKKRTKRK